MITAVITGLIIMRKRRVGMEVFTPKMMKLWKDWELRAMVVTSLLVQIILILLGSQRKYIPKIKIRAIVWCSYLLADSVATIALGILTNNLGDIYDEGGVLDLNTKHTAFWAPFLLLHLGGPDTITAYSLEDNQLWLRHFFGLIIQTVVTVYIFLMAWSDSRLSLLSIPMIVVGSIKYGERTWTLWKASSDELRDSMLTSPDPGPNYSKLMNEYRLRQAEGFFMDIEEVKDVQERLDVTAPEGTTRDGKNIIKAHALFQTFKRLFADLILSFKDREKSQSLFQELSHKDAFDVVAIELGFMYDMLYTKAAIVYTRWGFARRITTFSLTCLVLVIFSFEDMKEYNKVDIFITFLLLVVAILLEIYAVLILLFSDQTSHWLIKNNKIKVLKVIDSLAPLLKLKRWSSCVPQFSLLGICLKEKPHLEIMRKVVERWPPENYVEVDDHLKELIYKHVKEKFNQFKEKQDDTYLKDLCSQRGNNILEKYKRQTGLSLEWSINVEFDQSILIWHIATELCYFSETLLSTIPSDVQSSREVSQCISNYMFCLLAIYPFLLPIGIGLIRFRDTRADAKRFFKERSTPSRTGKKNRIDCSNMLLQVGDSEVEEEDQPSFRDRKKRLGLCYSREEPIMYQMITACKMLLQENIDVLPGKVKGDSSKSVLLDACRLASALNGMTDRKVKWDMIRDVWLEMLAYAASHSRGSQHCLQLRRGGELLTHVWLLMAHFGMSEQFQISKGYARALLIAK